MKRYLIKYRKDNGIVKGEEYSIKTNTLSYLIFLIKLIFKQKFYNHIEIDKS